MHRFSGVVLLDPHGRLLLQERDEHPVIDPDTWSFVGGHVEDGESFEAAAYRELAEETEIVLPPGTLRLHGEFGLGHERVMQVFVAPTDLADDDVVCHEGRQIVFVDPAALADLPLSESARTILPGLLAAAAR